MTKQRRWIFPVFLPNIGCPHRCAFCDQHVVTGNLGGLPDIQSIDDMFNRVRFSRKNRDNRNIIRQIAFYGGNFSGLSRGMQERYLNWAAEKVESGLVHSIRFSTRPDALGGGEISFLKGYPVKTVEIGVQSLNDTVLHTARRGHTAEDSKEAIAKVVSNGWEACAQLMPGLPGETLKGFLRGVEMVSGWGIRYARLYPAVVLKGTELAGTYESGAYNALALEEAVVWCARACEILEAHGVEVIRIGLPASDELKASVIAGPYHPAFGFLVQSFRFHEKIRAMIMEGDTRPLRIRLSPMDIPLLMGEKRTSWDALRLSCEERELNYYPDPSLPKGDVRMESG